MDTKFTTVTSLRKGSYVTIDGQPCIVKSIDISKTGKHGSSKARIEAVGLVDRQKRIIIKPGHENIPVPIIEKRRAQVLSRENGTANIMDSETFENLDLETFRSDTEEGRLKIVELNQKFRKEVGLANPLQGRLTLTKLRQGKTPIIRLDFEIGNRAITGSMMGLIAPEPVPQLNADILRK